MGMLKLLSVLLSYPQADMLAALDEMVEWVNHDSSLPEAERAGLLTLIEGYRSTDLLDLQQQYVALFDRGRNLSLHLFEHIHGESRDRGQAMVELMRLYQSHGFEIATRELPDYIPLFLEYLSQRPTADAREWLCGALPVLALLEARLEARGSAYATLFQAMRCLAGAPVDVEALRERAAGEEPDATLVKMDEIWEEEAVRFMSNPEDCQNQNPSAGPQPVNFASPHVKQPKPAPFAEDMSS